ncbi:MAG TPA: hypothetical protein VGR57_19970 [Ktedonobacterales bacterium]|nr:hypothetical protein [Ktedonobacterales bacterium]
MRDFDAVLTWLRSLEHPCAPPIGVGEFDVRYASGAEVVVWYTPARDGHRIGEVAIPTAALAAAWQALAAGDALDEDALAALGGGAGTGRWLLAVLALLPEVRAEGEPLRLRLQPATPATRRRRRPSPPAASA